MKRTILVHHHASTSANPTGDTPEARQLCEGDLRGVRGGADQNATFTAKLHVNMRIKLGVIDA